MTNTKQREELKIKLHNVLYSEGVKMTLSVDKAISEFIDVDVANKQDL